MFSHGGLFLSVIRRFWRLLGIRSPLQWWCHWDVTTQRRFRCWMSLDGEPAIFRYTEKPQDKRWLIGQWFWHTSLLTDSWQTRWRSQHRLLTCQLTDLSPIGIGQFCLRLIFACLVPTMLSPRGRVLPALRRSPWGGTLPTCIVYYYLTLQFFPFCPWNFSTCGFFFFSY